jgi:energy-coupling factor transporter transmembrane protein EcfT
MNPVDMTLSPAMKLIAVLVMAVMLQTTPGLLLALVIAVWMLITHRVLLLKLLRRVRLLIAVLFVITLLMTPGTALFPEWGLYPTQEGLHLALIQMLRLIGMLAAVAWLLATTDDQELAAGSLALLQPLAGNKDWPERAVARLLLVFHYLEDAPKPRNLQEILRIAQVGQASLSDAPTEITLKDAEITPRDIGFTCVALLLAVFCVVFGVSG